MYSPMALTSRHRAFEGLGLADQAALIGYGGIAAFGIGDILEQQVVGVAVARDIQAQPPAGDNFRAAAVKRLADGGEIRRGPFGSGGGEIAVADERIPIGVSAMLCFEVDLSLLDGASQVDGEAAALLFAAGSGYSAFLGPCRFAPGQAKSNQADSYDNLQSLHEFPQGASGQLQEPSKIQALLEDATDAPESPRNTVCTGRNAG